MHIHECDEAENPGYLILQAFDYCEAAGDPAFLEELMPMLRWAMEVQVRHLYRGMMPFCGDETYVAGGMLPRVDVDDGSCEATMLLIESGRRMTPYEHRREIFQGVEEARQRFTENFLRDGRLITNNPERERTRPDKKEGRVPILLPVYGRPQTEPVQTVHLSGLCRENRGHPLRPHLCAFLRADDAGLHPQRSADGWTAAGYL